VIEIRKGGLKRGDKKGEDDAGPLMPGIIPLSWPGKAIALGREIIHHVWMEICVFSLIGCA